MFSATAAAAAVMVVVALTRGGYCETSSSAVGDPLLKVGVATRVDDGIRSDE